MPLTLVKWKKISLGRSAALKTCFAAGDELICLGD